MTDPITDMLNQIKNAQAVEKPEVLIPLSNIKYEIARILSERHFIGEIKKLKRVSKPGQKIYEKSSEIKRVHGGFGISIISTSKGLMTNIEARKQKLGGEVICEVW